MTRSRLLWLGLSAWAAGSLLLSTTALAQADWRKQYPKFRYGVQAVETQAAALTRYKGFGEYVKKKLGVEPLVVPTNNDGTIGYYAVAFVRADSAYRNLNDLKGRIWAWVEPNSSSGYIFPLVGFRKMGIEPEQFFGKVVFSGGHEQSIIGVLDKAYDGAITWTNDVEKHTRGGLHMMFSRGVVKKEDIRIIWVSDLIPNPVIAIRSDLPKEMKAELKAMFLGMHKDDPKVFKEVVRGESQGYKEVQHSVYQIAVDLRQQLAKERRGKN